jgi:hypothetical protein
MVTIRIGIRRSVDRWVDDLPCRGSGAWNVKRAAPDITLDGVLVEKMSAKTLS